MKLSRIEHSDHITLQETKYLGGKIPFFQSLLMGGTGSPRILYNNGIEKWDELNNSFEHKTICTFQLLKNGIVIYWNKNQIIRAALVLFDEIERIEINSFKVNAKPLLEQNIIKDVADLKLKVKDRDESINFYIPANKHKRTIKFFQKHFEKELKINHSQDAPILSNDPLYTSYYLHGLKY